MIKRYLVFGGNNYYPGGGWDDFIGSFDTVEDAQMYVLTNSREWWEIVDLCAGQRILTSVLI